MKRLAILLPLLALAAAPARGKSRNLHFTYFETISFDLAGKDG